MSPEEVLDEISSGHNGLSTKEADKRLAKYGPNSIQSRKFNVWILLWRQVTGNPLVIILAVATAISYVMGEHTSAYYIFAMILLSVGLGFWNEFAAERTVRDLLKKVSLSAIVNRDGEKREVPVAQITVGDIVFLAPGSIIPADMRFIETDNLEVDQSTLTGESKTAFKLCCAFNKKPEGLNDYANIGFMGTIVTSGSGKGAVLSVGKDTEFGKIAREASFIKPETDFQKGLRRFGDLIVKVILVLSIGIFAVNFLLGHSTIDSLLFALAIAVGLTPELLPIIVTVSLSHGAGKLAKKHVICKQLIAIENLGNMDILCTDKTGTLTEGKIVVTSYVNEAGESRPELLLRAITCNNAIHHHKIIGNAIDIALWEAAHKQKIGLNPNQKKIFEEPFDYEKRAMFCVIEENDKCTLIVKGSPDVVLQDCTKKTGLSKAQELNQSGLRLVAIATKNVPKKASYSWNDLTDLHFEGFVTFLDIPKKSAKASILKMEKLGVAIKIVTGDSELVSKYVCQEVGLPITGIITGADFVKLNPEKQKETALGCNVFARVTPSQKLQIIGLLRKAGHTVGYMGDGLNDISALHSADVGISVNTAVDVAKDAAPIVLLRNGLDVITNGIIEGRSTFSNTMKYILMGTSSNFGNMFSAAGASFFLPFLPMMPSQILLNNGLYDLSQISIPTDNVDPESLRKPRHWDIKFIKYYMLFFGPISSLYDFLTFGLMIYVFHASEPLFQTGWFVESLATQILVVFIIRTNRRPFYKSRPSKWLAVACLGAVAVGIILPYSPLASGLGFVPLPPVYFLCLALLVGTYLLLVAKLRARFLKRFSF